MKKEICDLIEAINMCNLSEKDKKVLIKKLSGNYPDIIGTVQLFLHLLQIGEKLSDFFP